MRIFNKGAKIASPKAGTPVFLKELTMRPVEPMCSWFRHLVYEEKDDKTLREYAYIVRRFVHVLESGDRGLLEATESDFRAYRVLRTQVQDNAASDQGLNVELMYMGPDAQADFGSIPSDES